jgi:hypothetical protein
MNVGEAHRNYQATLEAARAAMPHAPACSTDPYEATEDTIAADVETAHTAMVVAWRAWAARRLNP